MGRMAKDKTFLAALGRRLAQARKTRGLTQADLARRASLTIRYVSMVETGKRNPTVLVLNDLAKDGLGITASELLKGLR